MELTNCTKEKEYIRITEKTLHSFLPLLSEEEQYALQHDTRIYAIGAVCQKTACGVLVFRISGEVLDIRYIIVADAFRRQRIATGMVRYLCQHAWAFAIPVTCTFSATGLEDELYLFFVGLEQFSVAEEQGFYCTISTDRMEDSLLVKMKQRSKSYQQFFSLSPITRRRFLRMMLNQDIYYLRELREEQCVKPLCLCAVVDDEVKAAIFITRGASEEQDLELSCAWCSQGREMDLMGLFKQAFEMLKEEGTVTLRIAAVTPASAALVDRLIPHRVVTERFYRAVWDMEL